MVSRLPRKDSELPAPLAAIFSALKVPGAANETGFCLDVFTDSLLVNETVSILDDSGRISALVRGVIPCGTCTVDQNLAEIDVAALADAQQLGLASGRILSWHQA